MTKLRDYLQQKLKEACYVKVVQIKRGHETVATAYLEHDGWSINVFGGGVFPGFGVPGGICPSDQDISVPAGWSTEHTPTASIVVEVESVLSTMQQIATCQATAASYAAANARTQQSLAVVQAQVTSSQSQKTQYEQQAKAAEQQVTRLQQQLSGANPIEDTLRGYNPQQKAHVLQKVWGAGDADSVAIASSIKRSGFDPHYVARDGRSLVSIALTGNDQGLFDLLVANRIDFNTQVGDKTLCKLIIKSGKQPFINKMLATGQDFSKSVLSLVLTDDADGLAVVLRCKADLAKIIVHGQPLLNYALEKGCVRAAEELLKTNPELINYPNSAGFSPVAVMILKGNGAGVEFFKSRGVDINAEAKKAVANGQAKYLVKMLTICPDMLDQRYDGLPLGHFVVEHGTTRLLADLLRLKDQLRDSVDSEGRSLIDFALLTGKVEFAKLLIGDNATGAIRSALERGHLDVATKIIALDVTLLPKLTQVEHIQLMRGLLVDAEFARVSDAHGNSLLHFACGNGNFELAAMVLAKNPESINRQNDVGKTPLHLLLESGLEQDTKVQIAEIILAQHPNIRLEDADHHTVKDLALSNPTFAGMCVQQGLLGDTEDSDLAA